MKASKRCLWVLLCFGFMSSVWAQNQTQVMHPSRHLSPRHRMADLLSRRMAQPGGQLASAITCDKSRTWNLGAYPGGTTAALQSINNFGVAMGWGDVPIEGGTEVRMIGVPLFGFNAGQWFESGVSSEDWTGEGGGISDTGMIAGNIMGANGWPEAYAWTPNHFGFHLGRYSDDDGSVAIAINHSGMLIVGNSGKLLEDQVTMRVTPLVWTSKVVWNEGRPTLSWDMHALPTGGWEKPGAVFPGVTLNFWGGWGVNDLGQIAGDGWTSDENGNYWEIAVVWTPTARGGWRIQRLSDQSNIAHNQYTEALAINNRGEIVGDYWGCTEEACTALPALWKVNATGARVGKLTVLGTLSGAQQGWNVAWGINDLGDVVGVSNDASGNWLATHWKTKYPSTATVLGFPGDWSVGFGVNNFGIAVGTYGVGEAPEQAVAVLIH